MEHRGTGFTDLLLSMEIPAFEHSPYQFSSVLAEASIGRSWEGAPDVGDDCSESSSQKSVLVANIGSDGFSEGDEEQAEIGGVEENRNFSMEEPAPGPGRHAYGGSPPSPRPWKRRFRYGEIPDFRQPSAGRKSLIPFRCRTGNWDGV